MGSSRFQYPGSRDPRIPGLGFHTPRCHRTSGRLPQPRRHWLCIWHRRSSEHPRGTPCRTEDRTDTRVLPSLSHVMQSAASGHLVEFQGCPISPPSPLSTSTRTRAPSLHRHYPASPVLRAHPTPHRARSDLHRSPVGLSPTARWGLPCCSGSRCVRAVVTTPVEPLGCLSLSSPAMPAFPVETPGQLPHRTFRGLLDVYSRYSPHTRGIT